ncbi:MAG: sel1 repeat family protein [Planctomycetes bacterium]|nr:sel1 repeat family protein [Planctomycetota bacterium]
MASLLAERWRRLVDAPDNDERADDVLWDLHDQAHRCFYALGAAGDRRRAVKLYRAAATGGLGASAFNLAVCLEFGLGVRRDLRAAFAWYVRAAESGDARAKIAVAQALVQGRGVWRDVRTGMRLFARLARTSVLARRELAELLLAGEWVRRDRARAMKLLRGGVALGSARCRTLLAAEIHDHARGDAERRAAVALCRTSARAGDALACWYLSLAYETGSGVRESEQRCIAWLERGAKLEQHYLEAHYDAALELAERYELGRGVSRSLRRARQILRAAAVDGSEGARRELARLGAK